MQKEVRDAFVGRLAVEENDSILATLVEELGPLVPDDEGVATALKDLYQASSREDTRLRVLHVLQSIYEVDANTRAIYMRELQGEGPAPAVVLNLFAQRADAGDSDVVSAIVDTLAHTDEKTRKWAEDRTARLIRGGRLDIRELLLQQLADENANKRAQATRLLAVAGGVESDSSADPSNGGRWEGARSSVADVRLAIDEFLQTDLLEIEEVFLRQLDADLVSLDEIMERRAPEELLRREVTRLQRLVDLFHNQPGLMKRVEYATIVSLISEILTSLG